MFFILSKILLFLIKPLVWILFVFFRGIFTKDEVKRKRRLIIATIMLFLMSNNFLVNELVLRYEYRTAKTLDSNYKVAIVLGGFAGKDKATGNTVFYESSDRLLQAVSLYKQHKVQRLLISSGSGSLTNQSTKEADIVKNYLMTLGIPDSAIISENRSRNTEENAEYSFKILDSLHIKDSILVISSAWHLPRAKVCFDVRENIDYYPVNFMSSDKRDYAIDNLLMPSPKALYNLELVIKEWVGYVVYWLRK